MATQNKPAADARALAARVLVDVLVAGRSLGDVLPPAQAALDDPRAGALVQELCYGTLRWYFRLDAVLQALLSKPLKSRDADVRCLLLTGLYQIDQLALPQRVAVHETVQAVRALDKYRNDEDVMAELSAVIHGDDDTTIRQNAMNVLPLRAS